MAQRDPIAEREKFVEGWNNTMVDIWIERIDMLGIIDTRALLRSPIELPVEHDKRFYEFTFVQKFLEYGLGRISARGARCLSATRATSAAIRYVSAAAGSQRNITHQS